jgi:hypothetical protein
MAPYQCAGIGTSGSSSESFMESLCLTMVASVLVLWEVDSIDKEGLKVSQTGVWTAVLPPKADIMVRIKRRRLS